MIFNHCMWQLSEYSFKMKDTTTLETYENANIDRDSFTNVILTFRKVNDEENELTLDITERLEYLYNCGGTTINFQDFGVDLFNGYNYFPDYLYETSISYTYNGETYTSDYTRGFHALISRVVYQKTQQSDWKKTLGCNCNCEKSNSVLRMWHFMEMLATAAELCLLNEWLRILKALYKITGTEWEFAE